MEEPRRLGGRYELGSVLGRGGMAEVYLAHDTRLGRTVAVKTLRVDLARDPSFQARFRREAQSAASLNHPAIVAVYDTGEDMVPDGTPGAGGGVSIPYIVMEYVDGSTLRELLHSGRKLLPERSMEMCVGILQALEYSHRNGIVHRDIKPANVMLTRTGQVKVMDFGIARAMGDSGMTMTQTAAVIGTAQYLSPEQAKGETVDSRSDLYSTGCLLYELLTVRPPFVGDSPVAVAYQHVREEPQPPSAFDPEISPETDAIVMRALVKDPDYRYQSADEMRADIEACLDGQPVAATAALGAVPYGYPDEQPTTSLRPQNPQTSMMAPVGDDGYDDGRGRRRPPRKSPTSTILLILAALLVLVGAVFVGKALFGGTPSDNVTVPALEGLSLNEAKKQASNGGFEVTEGTAKYCAQPKDRVCSTDPAEGAEISRGDSVTLVMSKGAKPVDVPDVDGLMYEEAKGQLEDAGFKVKRKPVESGEPENTVIDQNPDGNQKAQKNSTVTLTVAVAQKVTVPNVVGKSYTEAEEQLKALGFDVARKDEETEDKPADEVISQNPAGSLQHPKGTQVTLTVAKAPDDAPATVPDVTNKPLGEAKKALQEAGFTVGAIRGPKEDDALVVGTNPPANHEGKKGDKVNILTRPKDDGEAGGGGVDPPPTLVPYLRQDD
ncbi:Stk1 family PASTA domain-containing Ser/Thr kinase [Streptomyces sp. AJS327]|uniref:Stk1 family PASTA domain-containing Ser/Thr kinase n=1 Tax=Streptomyces sp. AJS327 TaxID=2545265 RepID=UPI0015DE303F|nr:Stk1 family PASTA domain-containing Ser/Thr kinase [Streptomyces sp. AJS327]MBA0052937.1 Stk1 family PASTA domain-containing Ser/Thr kinase [Streptomyces sp. AJS327]